jgi:hypothetical protein
MTPGKHVWNRRPDSDLPGFVAFCCSACGLAVWTYAEEELARVDPLCPGPNSSASPANNKLPSLVQQAWNLAGSLVDFIADGCRTVTKDQYRRRLEICDACEFRLGNRCVKCGCRLALKARGRAFRCPLGKWPAVEDAEREEASEPGTSASASA